ncbi:MAG: FUSC family protein [Thermomicrobiales bacterium]|nr:FUSC family protein [Thermomicrobiales bacterium]MCO5227241.1 FUSC family protein [Thermomicrobiales bacterium]
METGNRYLASIGQAAYGLSPLTHAMAVRNAIGLVVTLVLAMVFLSPSAALVGGMGAIAVAVADRPGLDVTKAPRMLWTVGGSAIAAFVGALLGGHTSTEIAAVSIAAFCVGVLSAYGTGSLQSGVASLLVLLVAASQPQHFTGSLGYIGIVIVAGVIQTILALSAAPAPARNPEGHALDRIFRDLAAYIRAPDDRGEAPAAIAFTQAHAYHQAFAVYRSTTNRQPLLDNAYRLQSEVMALADATRQITDSQPELYERWLLARRALAESLEGCGQLLVGGTSLASVEVSIARSRSQLTAIAGELKSAEPRQIGSWRKLARTLLVHLDQAAFMADSQREERIGGVSPGALLGLMRDRFRATMQLVRLNVHVRSPMLRHAIRLTFAVLLASSILVALDISQWYWSTLAVLIVLRPFSFNAVQRMWESWLGLIIGLVVGTVTSLIFHEATWVTIAIIGLFIFLQRLYGASNVGFGMTMIAATFVSLWTLTDVMADEALIQRALCLSIGGAIALGIQFAWPSWDRLGTRDLIAECIDRYRDAFSMAVSDAIVQTQIESDQATLRRTIARAARASTEEVVRRPENAPGISDDERDTLTDILTQLRALVWSAMRLEAYARMLATEDNDQELVLAYQAFVRASERVLEDTSHAITHHREPQSFAMDVAESVVWMSGVVMQSEVENRESPVLSWYGVTSQADTHAKRLQQIEKQISRLAVMSGSGYQG